VDQRIQEALKIRFFFLFLNTIKLPEKIPHKIRLVAKIEDVVSLLDNYVILENFKL
jgi:histidyl-tRNA synthetase